MKEQITPEDIDKLLEKVYALNLKDAEEHVKIFETSGDSENLERAKQDKEKWERKIENHKKKKPRCR